jgi:ribosomal protein L37E
MDFSMDFSLRSGLQGLVRNGRADRQDQVEMASPSLGRLIQRPSVEPMDRACPNCDERSFAFAKTCPHCGAPRQRRMADVMLVGALTLLLIAIVVAIVAVLRGERLAAATETGAAADAQIAAGSTADLSWLATAMSGCDAEAKTDAGKLYFLVTPLTVAANDMASWRAKSINDMGNGILLRADDMLDGLKNGSLRLYPADYDFRMLDQASDTVYKWRAAAGVARFSAADTSAIATFKVQFRTAYSGSDAAWGSSFNRQQGSCHWVNAIISH